MPNQQNEYVGPLAGAIIRLLEQKGMNTRQLIHQLPDQEFITVKDFNLEIASLKRDQYIRENKLGYMYVMKRSLNYLEREREEEKALTA
mgnify:CR=1 FL=1